jgi:hypothetical protein
MEPKRSEPAEERTESQVSLNRDLSNAPGTTPSAAAPQTRTSQVEERSRQERDPESEDRSVGPEFSTQESTDTSDDESSAITEAGDDEAAPASGLSGESSESEANDDEVSSNEEESHDDSAAAEGMGDENSVPVVTTSEGESSAIDTSTADNSNDGPSDDAKETSTLASEETAVDAPRPVRMPTYSSSDQQHNVALPLALPVMLRGADAIFMKALEKALPELCKVFEDQITDYDNQLKFELTAEMRAIWH